MLRNEVRSLHLKPIKNLEGVAIGLAEFENKIHEYVEAGGKPYDDGELKSDVLAILPQELRENLLWRASDPGPGRPLTVLPAPPHGQWRTGYLRLDECAQEGPWPALRCGRPG